MKPINALRMSSGCELSQTHFSGGTYTASDTACAKKRSGHARLHIGPSWYHLYTWMPK